MNLSTTSRPPLGMTAGKKGFSLVATVAVLALLAVIAIGLLSLSSVTLRSTGALDAQSGCKAGGV